MPDFTISKMFSLVMMLVMMIFFFVWITGQVSDLGLFFGFRTSHTVANDIAGVITSVGGVPGNPSVSYTLSPGQSTGPNQRIFKYDIDISDKMVCVTSFLDDESRATTDCASHPYDLEEGKRLDNVPSACLVFEKTQQENEDGSKSAKMNVRECG